MEGTGRPMTETNNEATPKVLVVDDSRVMRVSAEKILAEEFEVVLAENGEEAWAALNRDPEILAVFTDVAMPGLDGYELLAQIRNAKTPVLQEMPVIIVTGDEEEDAREAALERGASDFITKPFERSQLIARARSHAGADQMRRHARALEEGNTIDQVTGLGNRRYFEQRLREARAYALRHDETMALIRFDLIDFDQLLASRGKRVGIQVAAEVGGVVAENLREEDVPARISGGRFAVICPSCSPEGAEKLARRLLNAISGETFAGEHEVSVSAAAGVHIPANDPSVALDELFRQTQAAVARAVETGGGEVIFATESLRPESAEAAPEAAPEAAGPPPDLARALELAQEDAGVEELQAHADALLPQIEQLLLALPAKKIRELFRRIKDKLV